MQPFSINYHKLTIPGRLLAGKVTIRETSFRETSHPGEKLSGKRFPRNVLSGGKIRESYCPGKRL